MTPRKARRDGKEKLGSSNCSRLKDEELPFIYSCGVMKGRREGVHSRERCTAWLQPTCRVTPREQSRIKRRITIRKRAKSTRTSKSKTRKCQRSVRAELTKKARPPTREAGPK